MQVKSPFQIKKERQALGWTQSRLAGLLGVTKNTISRMERGETISYELRHRITMLLEKREVPNGTISKSS